MLKRYSTLWTLVLSVWMLIGLSFTLNYYFFSAHYVAIFREPPTLGQMLVWEIPYWLLWAGLAPVVFLFTRRFPIDRERWFRNSLLHILACIVLTIAHRAIYLIIGWLLHVAAYQNITSIPALYSSDILFNLPTGFMSYGTIFLITYVIDYYRRHQGEELKISRLKTELAEAQLQVTEAQLQALKMQLHPHFLFNTLNSISALLDEDAEAADQMLARLGDFLRLTLENSGAQQVTLQEELEFLRCYLEIEHVRFHDRLTVNMLIEPDTLDARVPNLILQPIVENAIRHGIVSRIAPRIFCSTRSTRFRRCLMKTPKPQKITEPREHLICGFGVFIKQRRNRVERVEQKMRMKLHLQSLKLGLGNLKLRLGELGLQARDLQLLFLMPAIIIDHVTY